MGSLVQQLGEWPQHHAAVLRDIAAAGVFVLLGLRIRRLVRQWRAPLPERERQLIASGKGLPIGERPPTQRFLRGALTGLAFPGIFSLFVLTSLIFGGRYQTDRHQAPEDELVLFVGYLAGSALLMAVLFLCWPWLRRLAAAVAVGCLAVIPMTVGIVASQDNHFTHWTSNATWACVGFSLVMGTIVGVGVRHRILRIEAAREAGQAEST